MANWPVEGGGTTILVAEGQIDRNQAAGDGNFSVTGLSFAPLGVNFFISETGAGDTPNSFGVASGGAAGISFVFQDSGVTSINTGNSDLGSDFCKINDGTNVMEFDLVSLNSDGFTLNASQTAGTITVRIGWFAWGA